MSAETGESPLADQDQPNHASGSDASGQTAETAQEQGFNATAGEQKLAELEAAEARAEEHFQALLRARAELENLQRRHQKELENAHKYANERLVLDLLPVLDSMENALQVQVGENSAQVASLLEGSRLTLAMLMRVLLGAGVEVVDPVGGAFNPELHQAMSLLESADLAPGSVAQVVQKGYRLNGRLIRPAMVMVAKAPEISSG